MPMLAIQKWFLFFGIICLFSGNPLSLQAEESDLTDPFLLAFGGRLYDNWFAELKVRPPKRIHPSYPKTGRKKGSSTWRCKECHGWDYKGKEGNYSSGSHTTGIRGIRAMVGKDPILVEKILRDSTHAYTPLQLSPIAVKALAAFVVNGQIDMSDWIDEKAKAKGESGRGRVFFRTLCAICHGIDGQKMNFGTQIDPEYIGTVAKYNPWEVLHKIRNGQPGELMISLRALTLQQQADLIAYEQTLKEQ